MTEQLGITLNFQAAKLGQIPPLTKGNIHLWWLPLTLEPQQKATALTLLSDIQQDKYARRASAESQDAYLAGRFYLLNLLAAYTDVEPDAVELSYSRLNKPSLSHKTTDLHFNFTDTPGRDCSYGLFSFSLEHELGVDIEAKHRRSNFTSIAEKRFTQREKQFAFVDDIICPEKFLAVWTRKEAFGKATGQGINFKMNQRNLVGSIDEERYELTFSDEQNRAWRLLQLELGDEFIASVVHASHETLSITAFHSLAI